MFNENSALARILLGKAQAPLCVSKSFATPSCAAVRTCSTKRCSRMESTNFCFCLVALNALNQPWSKHSKPCQVTRLGLDLLHDMTCV